MKQPRILTIKNIREARRLLKAYHEILKDLKEQLYTNLDLQSCIGIINDYFKYDRQIKEIEVWFNPI